MGSVVPRSRENVDLAASPAAAGLRPRVRPDLDCWVLFENGGRCSHIVGSRQIDRYVALPEAKARLAMEAVTLMDGSRTFDEIADELRKLHGVRVDVGDLHARLASAGLTEGADVPTVGEFEKLSVDVLALRVTGLFSRLRPLARWAFIPAVAGIAGVVCWAAWVLVHSPAPDFHWGRLVAYRGSWLLGFALLGALMILASALHELAHGLTAVRFGLLPTEFRMRFYLGFIPAIFLRIPGLYTVSRPARLAVYSAGIVSNLFLASVAFLLWSSAPAHGAADLSLRFAVANLIMAAQNLVPFLPTDGYHVASTLLGRANVRTAALREFLKWRAGESHAFRGSLAAYFAASVVALVGLFVFAFYRRSVPAMIVLGLGMTMMALKLLRKGGAAARAAGAVERRSGS